MPCRAPGRLPWKSLATFPPRVPSPTSSTELYSFRIISWKVKTNRITGQSTATGKVPLIKERFLSKQTGPPLSSDRLESRSGLTIWLELRWYPLILELYTAGIAAVDAQRYDNLATLFYTQLPSSEYRDQTDTFVETVSNGLLEIIRTNAFKKIPGHERHYTPLSEYLFKILQPRLDDTFFLGKNYEAVFDELN